MKPSTHKTLTLYQYFTIGFGSIVGTGWVLMVGDWVTLGGGPLAAMIAFAVGAVCLLPIGAVLGELSAALPISGGIIDYIERSFGRRTAFFAGWLLVFGDGVLCPWEALAMATILTELVADVCPWLKSVHLYTIAGSPVYLFPVMIALLFSAGVIVQNFRGVNHMAALQKWLTRALFLGVAVAVVVSLVYGSPTYALPLYAPVAGATGVVAADTFLAGIAAVLVLTPFFYTGLDTIPDQAEEASETMNWAKFGQVIVMALLASAVFYGVCIYSFSTIVPWTEFVLRPLPALAVLSDIHPALYTVMVAIAFIGPLGPMNALFSATARILLAMGRKRMLPSAFGALHPKTGTPMAANRFLAVLTVIGPFLGHRLLLPLTTIAALAFIVPCTLTAMACWRMRDREPDLPRPYRVPGGKFCIGSGIVCGMGITLLLVWPWGSVSLSAVEWAILLVWLMLGYVLYYYRGQRDA